MCFVFLALYIPVEACAAESTQESGSMALINELKNDWIEKSNEIGRSKLVSKPYKFWNLYCEKTILDFEFSGNFVKKESLEFRKLHAIPESGESCKDVAEIDFFRVESEGSPARLLSFYLNASKANNFDLAKKNKNIFDKKYQKQIVDCFVPGNKSRKIFFGQSSYDLKTTDEVYEIYVEGCFEETTNKILVITGDDSSGVIRYSALYKTLIDVDDVGRRQ